MHACGTCKTQNARVHAKPSVERYACGRARTAGTRRPPKGIDPRSCTCMHTCPRGGSSCPCTTAKGKAPLQLSTQGNTHPAQRQNPHLHSVPHHKVPHHKVSLSCITKPHSPASHSPTALHHEVPLPCITKSHITKSHCHTLQSPSVLHHKAPLSRITKPHCPASQSPTALHYKAPLPQITKSHTCIVSCITSSRITKSHTCIVSRITKFHSSAESVLQQRVHARGCVFEREGGTRARACST